MNLNSTGKLLLLITRIKIISVMTTVTFEVFAALYLHAYFRVGSNKSFAAPEVDIMTIQYESSTQGHVLNRI